MSSYPHPFVNLLSCAFAPQEPVQHQQASVDQADVKAEEPVLQEPTGQDPGRREDLPGAREYIIQPPSYVAFYENQQQDQKEPEAAHPDVPSQKQSLEELAYSGLQYMEQTWPGAGTHQDMIPPPDQQWAVAAPLETHHQGQPPPGAASPSAREQNRAPTAAAAAGRTPLGRFLRSGRYHYVRDSMDRYICTFEGADGQPCQAVYGSLGGVYKHHHRAHEPKKLHQCRICVQNLFFSTHRQYIRHMQCVHPE
ncbi:hypothetical protein BO86DRAFT_432446 [Aspergillus japonicus CBS 114.51]|uniref:Uncharacterized protein n=1 Tax=Aspergillus japonicus CBS 114.51 TaxID=1448312 RepID=A0A8T8WY76_ASPJA|nr:hypothetical protein BO86DRAFT_432446 [Aspergillus japonicus CBS 114.51]RAH80816.1 hypothetical protein BO86DRAFT_432446 [Aspergillus japonicus CBS 114.51]